MKAYRATVEGTAYYSIGHKKTEPRSFQFDVDMNYEHKTKEIKKDSEGKKFEKVHKEMQNLEELPSRARYVAKRMLARHILKNENKDFRSVRECDVMSVEAIDVKEKSITKKQAMKMKGVTLLKECAVRGIFFKSEFLEHEIDLKRKCLEALAPHFSVAQSEDE